jgi:mono/diheme cytochrome c family protein
MWRVVVVLGLVAGCARGALPPQPGIGPAAQLPAKQSVAASTVPPLQKFTQGEVLYIRHCAGCHGWEGRGNGPVAQQLEITPPSLRRPELFTQHTETELVARILLGKDLAIPFAPTAVPSTEAAVTALLGHLRRLPTIAWEQVHAGEDVYDSLCVSCHGVYGRGDGPMAAALPAPPRDLSSPPDQSQVSDEEMFRIISEGKGGMPGAKDVLSAKDLHAVVVFVRVLSPGYELYDRFCTSCHGSEGRPQGLVFQETFGTPLGQEEQPPAFDQAYMQTHTDEHLRVWVRHMLKENRVGMPHFAGELSAEKVRQILTYLRNLPPAS